MIVSPPYEICLSQTLWNPDSEFVDWPWQRGWRHIYADRAPLREGLGKLRLPTRDLPRFFAGLLNCSYEGFTRLAETRLAQNSFKVMFKSLKLP